MKLCIGLGSLVVCALLWVASASAEDRIIVHGSGGWQGLFNPQGRASLYHSGKVPVPPYFALHPPVYYSYPVPRPYGFSPYAYPDYVMTPEYKPVKPLTIPNPHVPDKAKPAESTKTAAAPRAIDNPFVETPGDASRLVKVHK